MTEYKNDYSPVEILGPGLLSDRFTRVRMNKVAAFLEKTSEDYLVFTETMRYRMDGQPHALDVSELKVLKNGTLTSVDGSMSVAVEVKG